MLAPLAVRRVRPAIVMAGGLALSAVGFAMLTRVDGTSGLALIVIGSVVLALGVAPVGTLATDIIVGSAPPERAGAASGISETGAEFGGALGIAVLGSIGTAVYRSEVADAVPSGVPHDAAEAARDTLGGAVAVADELPDRLGTGLLDAAREAFTQGLQLTAITSAALALGMAILVMVLLRHVRTGSEPEADTEPAGAVAGGAGIEKVLGRAAEVQDDCAPEIEES
jgi:DHA2 family multidrug resistance protein-like MFS transporter